MIKAYFSNIKVRRKDRLVCSWNTFDAVSYYPQARIYLACNIIKNFMACSFPRLHGYSSIF